MSKLNDLIAELCPHGVPFEDIGKLCSILVPVVKIKSNEYLTEGLYPIIDQGQNFIGGYTNCERVFPKDEYIIFGDHTCVVKYVNFAFAQGADGIKVLQVKKDVAIPRYFFHCMSNIKIDVSYARHWTKMKKQKIPVPPMEVQREIVRILDTFTELTTKLTVELTAELALRKKQYEYYRDLLLTFDANVEFKTISSVADSFTGLTYKPRDKSDLTGVLVLRSSNIKNSRLVFDDCVFVQMDKIPERTLAKENDILICVRNGSKELIGKSALIPRTEKQLAFGAFMSVLRAKPEINYKFLFYIWQSPIVQKRFSSNNSMPINQIIQRDFDLIKIPVPSLEEQERIVKILDRFDKLCNDISEGLPAEIEARKQQYEFYRDKLLNFKEAG